MWNVKYRAKSLTILFLLYSLQTFNLQIIAHVHPYKSSMDALAIHMDNASSSIKTANIYQTLGRVFHHKPSTLNCIGLCSAIMWALF